MNTTVNGKIIAVDVNRLGCAPDEAIIIRMNITEAGPNAGKAVSFVWKPNLTNGMPKYGYGVLANLLRESELQEVIDTQRKHSDRLKTRMEALRFMAATERLSQLWAGRDIQIEHKIETKNGKQYESYEPIALPEQLSEEAILLRIENSRADKQTEAVESF